MASELLQQPARVPRPANEAERLAALAGYGLLDSAEDEDFNLLAELAAELCEAPYAFVSLVAGERIWRKAAAGAPREEVPRDDSPCALAVLEDRLLHIPDLAADARTAGMAAARAGLRLYAGANLITSDGFRVGTLCVLDTRARHLTEHQQRLLVRLARQVVALMELRQRDRELGAALAAMQRLASEDGLTGLMNRRALIEALQREVERGRRYGTALAVVMLDIDHFKDVNDAHGHAMGDAVLRGVAATVREGLRAVDMAGRYGGEEFCLVLPDTDAAGAQTVAEALRASISARPYEDAQRSVLVTASFGIAVFDKEHPLQADELLRSADAALYVAKTSGRNRVVLA